MAVLALAAQVVGATIGESLIGGTLGKALGTIASSQVGKPLITPTAPARRAKASKSKGKRK